MTKFDKKELENSKRIFKSATPKYTADWFIKWVASAFILVVVTALSAKSAAATVASFMPVELTSVKAINQVPPLIQLLSFHPVLLALANSLDT